MTDDSCHFHGLTRAAVGQLLAAWGFAPTHALRLWRYLYVELTTDFAAMADVPRALRERLRESADVSSPRVAAERESDVGATTKYLFEFTSPNEPAARIETVLMRYADRATACLSSQAGCALGCVFCATGQAGFTRNLSAAEIVGQALHVERVLRGERSQVDGEQSPRAFSSRRTQLSNLVFMGMGEPLLNYDAVTEAIEILGDSTGLAIGAKQTTISTVGVVPGIIRLADERRRWSLAVSLHAANQDERAAIVPTAKAWPLDELMNACRYYSTKLDRKIFFEWTLIAGKNDGAEQARELANLLTGLPAQVNLIPLNATTGYDGAATDAESARRFQTRLCDSGIPSTIRTRRGTDAESGCGQLAGAN